LEVLSKVAGDKAHYENVKAKLLAAMHESEREAAAKTAEAAVLAAKAVQVCPRAAAEAVVLPKSEEGSAPGVERLTSLIKRAETALERDLSKAKRPYEAVVGELGRAESEFKRLKRGLAVVEGPAKRMREGASLRHKNLKKTACVLAEITSQRFNGHMYKRGHAGALDVDFSVGEMRLSVQLANTAPGSGGRSVTVTDTKSLSGGERSYTTLSFLLSLNASAESPFCAMDEWDVFMDVPARKVSLMKMLEYAAENRQRQFILLTPQDISSVHASEHVSIMKLQNARIGGEAME
jgi:chromosome segregation ATPase